MARLLDRYKTEIVPRLLEHLGQRNPLAAPRLEKICINMGVGNGHANPPELEEAAQSLTLIAGQRAVITRAKQAISTWRLRQGYQIGCRVTLRGPKMYEFLDRLVNVVLPRVRDFRGLSPRAFDGRGNYSLGISEKTVFPEIDPDKAQFPQGMDITLVTNAGTDAPARLLLQEFGFPFRETGEEKIAGSQPPAVAKA